jgi:DNA polymerase-1
LKWEIDGGHSLAAWGARLKEPKGDFHDFSKLSPEMVTYCQQDVRVTGRLYDFQKKYWSSPRWQEAIKTEHQAARICKGLSDDGFSFDKTNAVNLHNVLVSVRDKLDSRILDAVEFAPARVFVRSIVARGTKFGTVNATDFKTLVAAGYTPDQIQAGVSYDIYKTVPFNPGSPKQMVERLNSFGWKPFEKTKTHIEEARKWGRDKDPERLRHFEEYGWKVSEANLATLPETAPAAAHLLAQRLIVNARVSDLEEWLALVQPDGRIHGSFLPIGSWTGRMAHQRPNTANIGKQYADQDEYTPVELLKREYDGQLRALWGVPADHWQIGVDMDSAHLRVLAHLMNDPVFTKGLLSGNKKDGTDPHSMNKKALGEMCKSRDDAKTFIYSFLNGAGPPKVASILGCSKKEAKNAISQFIEYYPGLDHLFTVEIPKNAARGYFEGIDGRYVACDFEHGQLSGLLQNAEAIILKRSVWNARQKCYEAGWPIRLLNLVHDEVQIELLKDDEELAWKIGALFADEYRLTAEYYQLRCPFAGGVSVGKNWNASH